MISTVSVNAFMEQMTNVKTVEKAQTTIRLNADDTSRIQYLHRIDDQHRDDQNEQFK